MHEIASKLVQVQTQIRFYHWQTKSYARHQAYGGTYDAMDDLIDSFVEVLMGKYGRVPAISFEIVNSNTKDINSFIEETVQFFRATTEKEKEIQLQNNCSSELRFATL